MATKKDLYEILGVTKTATDADLKSSYRKLARLHHPDIDKTPGAAEKFKEISEAYQILSDPTKRKTYDQFGHAAFESGQGGFGGGFKNYSYSTGNPNVQFDFGGFEDPFSLFEQIFGMGGFGGGNPFGGAYQRRASYQMNLTFDEALHGVTKEVELKDDSGKKKRMSLKIPAGVDNGTKMRFGDIDIAFRVERHPQFIREGDDIFSESLFAIPQIVLGDIIEVETVWGKVKLKIPSGSQPGSLVRIREKGMPRLQGGGKGDHYVRIKLDVPQHLSSEEKRLYEELLALKNKKKNWF